MLQYFDTLTDDSGNSLLGATLAVTNYPSGSAATIYSTNGTANPIANATVSADITGQVNFFLPDGVYIFTYAYKGTQYKVRSPVQIIDPAGFVAISDSGGSANVYQLTSQLLPAQLYSGMKVEMLAAHTNTGASTLVVNGSAATPIRQPGGSVLAAGMVQANGLVRLEYDGTQFQLIGSQSQPFFGQTAAEQALSIVPTNFSAQEGWVTRYGADPSGATDSTTACQTACNVITQKGGGTVWFPAGTYLLNRNIFIGANTTVAGEGVSSLIKANPVYIGVNGGSYASLTSPLFMNKNYAASALTDTDIVIRDLSFNWGSVTISGGGAHSINLRFVDRVTIYNVFSQNGENVTALLNCRDTLTLSCHGFNCSNAYFDHWDGIQSATVAFCSCRHTPGSNTVQGIQFTGQGSYGDSAAAANFLVMGNRLFSINSTGQQASAIICNANGAASTSARMISIGNYVDTADNGIVYQGLLGNCLSKGDYLRNVTALPLFFHADASGSPNNCRVISLTMEDCNHIAGNIALCSVAGTNHRIEDLYVFNPGGVNYALICYFTATATNCFISIANAPNGTGGFRMQNSGTNCKAYDKNDADQPIALTTPTIASAATIAVTTPSARISGTTTITTITPPPGVKDSGGQVVLIPTGLWSTNTGGNIALASTAVVNKALTMTWDPFASLWYPSY